MVRMVTHQTFIGIVSLLASGLGYFGQPHILVRFMAARSIKVIPNACRISILWMLFCLGGAVSVGFFGAALLCRAPRSGGAGDAKPRARLHRALAAAL